MTLGGSGRYRRRQWVDDDVTVCGGRSGRRDRDRCGKGPSPRGDTRSRTVVREGQRALRARHADGDGFPVSAIAASVDQRLAVSEIARLPAAGRGGPDDGPDRLPPDACRRAFGPRRSVVCCRAAVRASTPPYELPPGRGGRVAVSCVLEKGAKVRGPDLDLASWNPRLEASIKTHTPADRQSCFRRTRQCSARSAKFQPTRALRVKNKKCSTFRFPARSVCRADPSANSDASAARVATRPPPSGRPGAGEHCPLLSHCQLLRDVRRE